MTNKASSVLAYESVQRDYPPIRLVVVILTSMASVVDLPDPVGPVRITMPSRLAVNRAARPGGNPAHSKSGIAAGIIRKQAPSRLAE